MTDTPTTSGMGLLLGILLGPFIAVPVIFLFILMLYTGLNYCELASAPLPAFRWWRLDGRQVAVAPLDRTTSDFAHLIGELVGLCVEEVS